MQNNQKQSFSTNNLHEIPKLNEIKSLSPKSKENNNNIKNSESHKNSSLLNPNSHHFYQNNLNQYKKKEGEIEQRLEPHNKVSIKGLFTFYREQQQSEQIKQIQPQKPKVSKNKERKKQIISKIEQQKEQLKQQIEIKKQVRKNTRSKLKNQRSDKKLRVSKNLSSLENKKSKKSKKSTRESSERIENKEDQYQKQSQQQSQQQSQIKQELPQQKQEQPIQKFLKNIKHRKQMPNKNMLHQSELDNSKKLINNLPISMYASPSVIIKEQIQTEREKFNKLFYPKQSSASELIVDDINADLQKLESQNKFMQLKTNKNSGREKNKDKDEQSNFRYNYQYQYKYQQQLSNQRKSKDYNNGTENLENQASPKKQIVIDQIFLKRSSSEIQKSLSYRKRLYTQQEQSKEGQTNQKKLQKKHSRLYTYGKDNIYSQMKLKQIIQLANRISFNREQTQPISPPTIKSQVHNARVYQISSIHENHPLKLPVIRNVRLSRELRKIEELKNEQQNRYNSNKSKNSSHANKKTSKMIDQKKKQKILQKMNKSKSTGHHNLNAQKVLENIGEKQKDIQKQEELEKGRSLLKKKLDTEPEMYCVALIDLSKSVNTGIQQKSKKSGKKAGGEVQASWNLKKKILFKKLGLSP